MTWRRRLDAYFDEEVQRVNAVAESVAGESEHPTILQTYLFKGTVYVRNGGDYVNKMLELAGGTHPFAELEPGQGGRQHQDDRGGVLSGGGGSPKS